jgi:hypothetical protein
MLRRSLALLLVLSWVTLSGMDALEDLDFDSHTTRDLGAASGWPSSSKPVKLTNDILELANANLLSLGKLVHHLEFEDSSRSSLFDAYSASKALRTHKEHRVLLI